MAKRFEYKFLMPKSVVADVRRELRPFVAIDPYKDNFPAGHYTVRSLYYDSPSMTGYRDKVEGVRLRKKFRIRGYNQDQDESLVFLEIKRKFSNMIEKNRAPLLYKNLRSLFATKDIDTLILSFSGNGKEKEDAKKFLFNYYKQGLKPMVQIIYDREAYVGKFDSTLRITFDKNLRSTLNPAPDKLFSEEHIRHALPNNVIFEVKFYTVLPFWMREIIGRYQLPRMALSKYTICLDSHFGKDKADKKYYKKLVKSEHRGF